MDKEIVVIKLGSSCLVNDEGLDQAKINGYAEQITSLDQFSPIVVSSGAVAAGRRIAEQSGLVMQKLPSQALAMLGSAGISEAWRIAFAHQDILSGQLLVTHREIDDADEGQSLKNALNINAEHGIISVLNENDALSQKELKKLSYGGDNDGLAAHIATLVGAKHLLLLTGVAGFLREGTVVQSLQSHEIQSALSECYESSNEGTGSMGSKLEAAEFAAKQGTTVTIAGAEENFAKIIAHTVGTRITR
ncbi:MAG: hypothetical protein QFB86_00060 [Patescibacteria group bacterium]|nr:hypothetical protein [Patescibacteria group bacterium]